MGRNPLALLAAVGTLLLQPLASAATPEFQISPHAGFGSIEVDALVGVNRERANADTYGFGASFGYLTPIGVVLEIGADDYNDLDLFKTFDNFRLAQRYASIGYQFELGHRWRLVPRVGRAHWKLHSKEGQIFNPGPEQTRDVSGDNYFWEIGVARQISRVVTLGVNFKRGQYEFGSTQSAAFTATFAF
jgi:hypothetical protein